jgi:hypothetical protein
VRDQVFAGLAASVAPGGTLLVVGHHPSDLETSVPRPQDPDLFFTAEELAAALGPDRWDILVAEARPRLADDPDGRGRSPSTTPSCGPAGIPDPARHPGRSSGRDVIVTRNDQP